MSSKNSDYYFLKGGGEMGELIREKDWSKTSLGDPLDWPQSLKTVVAMMLNNSFGMYIAWGTDYTQLYNDSYRPILGTNKHPKALGLSPSETFAEIWHLIESMFDGVMKGKSIGFQDFMLPLNRNGYVEECYFDFSYSPIRKDNGEVGGVLVTVIETTDKRNTEEALKESEARFRAIADDAPVFIFLAGENAEVEYLNKTWRDYTGISKNDSKGRAWAEITHPDDVDPATKIYMDGFNNRESCTFENRQKGTDGIYRTILWKATPRFSSTGQFIGMMGVGLDIDERKKSEEKLKESEEQFNTLANNIQNLAWIADSEGYIYWYNQRWYDYTGTDLEEMKGWGWEKVHHPDHKNRVVDFVKKAWQINESWELTFPLRGANGEYRWFLTRAYPVTDEEGNISNWIGTNTDITEQKSFAEQLEEQVITRIAELKSSEKKFYKLFNLSPITKTLSDASTGKIVMINDAFINLFGYSREETLNKSSEELGLLELKEREILINDLKSIGKIENREVSFIKKSGEKFIALASAEFINIGDKQFFLSAFNDISEIKKAEQNIKQKNIELEKLNKELKSFAYISSHDLQEPLRKIQTFSTRIIEKEVNNLSDNGKYMFNRMQEAAHRMQTLILDLLSYSRTNTEERKFEYTDLNRIVDEVREDLKEELAENKATIEASVLGNANIIPFQFRQLLHNLIGNALKFSNPHYPPHIKIDSEIAKGIELNNDKLLPNSKYYHITITDNGIGFDQQYSERIFEVFQRLHAKDEYHGTGIGLSIVKKIVENHNGIITAKGEPNKGATFDIYLPTT